MPVLKYGTIKRMRTEDDSEEDIDASDSAIDIYLSSEEELLEEDKDNAVTDVEDTDKESDTNDSVVDYP